MGVSGCREGNAFLIHVGPYVECGATLGKA